MNRPISYELLNTRNYLAILHKAQSTKKKIERSQLRTQKRGLVVITVLNYIPCSCLSHLYGPPKSRFRRGFCRTDLPGTCHTPASPWNNYTFTSSRRFSISILAARRGRLWSLGKCGKYAQGGECLRRRTPLLSSYVYAIVPV